VSAVSVIVTVKVAVKVVPGTTRIPSGGVIVLLFDGLVT